MTTSTDQKSRCKVKELTCRNCANGYCEDECRSCDDESRWRPKP